MSSDITLRKLVFRLLVLQPFLLTVAVGACGAREVAEQSPAAGEAELAKNNVWHKAKLRGVAFRAVGQEPAWLLEITNGKDILIVTNYGQEKKSFPYVEPAEDEAARRTEFRIDAETSVTIEGKPCTDSMSGESFQSTVTLTIAERTLKGCGRPLF